MSKPDSSANPSLPLHEVLEAEFNALHADLPSGYPSASHQAVRLKLI